VIPDPTWTGEAGLWFKCVKASGDGVDGRVTIGGPTVVAVHVRRRQVPEVERVVSSPNVGDGCHAWGRQGGDGGTWASRRGGGHSRVSRELQRLLEFVQGKRC
jgi:hypothetical protein